MIETMPNPITENILPFSEGYTLTEKDAKSIRKVCAVLQMFAQHSHATGEKLGNFLSAHDVPRAMLQESATQFGIDWDTNKVFRLQEALAYAMPGSTVQDCKFVSTILRAVS